MSLALTVSSLSIILTKIGFVPYSQMCRAKSVETLRRSQIKKVITFYFPFAFCTEPPGEVTTYI